MDISTEQLHSLYESGMTQKQIARDLNCSITTIRRKFKQAKVVCRSVGISKNRISEHLFNVIDTEEKAYWLGFLLADGCIAKSANSYRMLRLFLKRADKNHLRKFAKWVGYKSKLYADNRDNHPRLGVVFNSQTLCKALLDKGWMEFKRGGDTRIMKVVPPTLWNHFVRGYHDGDGCLSNYARKNRKTVSWFFTIVCKYRAPLELMSESLTAMMGPKSVKARKSVYALVYNGNKKLETLLNWLYDGATVYLDRKYSRRRQLPMQLPYEITTINNFEFFIKPSELAYRTDIDKIIDDFTDQLCDAGWIRPPKLEDDYDKICSLDISKYTNDVISTPYYGNNIIWNLQPMAWQVSRKKSPAIAGFPSHKNLTKKAVKALLTTGYNAYPNRLIREMLFVGFSRASITPAGAFIAAIKRFGLKGKWIDPCAGWGTRLLAAHLLDLEYEATDPGVCFSGLIKLCSRLKFNPVLHNDGWENVPINGDFVLTSPPFWDKEDYLDNASYGKFEDWYQSFVAGIVDRHQFERIVLHIDARIKNRLLDDFVLDVIPFKSIGRSKAPTEFFVEILDEK